MEYRTAEERQPFIDMMVKEGLSVREVASRSGISASTLRRWRKNLFPLGKSSDRRTKGFWVSNDPVRETRRVIDTIKAHPEYTFEQVHEAAMSAYSLAQVRKLAHEHGYFRKRGRADFYYKRPAHPLPRGSPRPPKSPRFQLNPDKAPESTSNRSP